jgi:gamma-glutamylcyclotransferase (GGCT)/AIG2-like uncharacterized protein YtfP
MPITLFVYGTLMRNRRGHALLAGQQFLGAARTAPRYRMLRRNWYPCLVEDGQGYAIEGEVWHVADEALAALDEYEGAADLFERRSLRVDGFDNVVAYFFLGDCSGLADCGPRWDGQ